MTTTSNQFRHFLKLYNILIDTKWSIVTEAHVYVRTRVCETGFQL